MDNKPIEQLFPAIHLATQDWIAKNNPEHIKARVAAKLDKSSDEIIMKLLGFDCSYMTNNVYKLDHCNGRSGNSTAGDYLKTQQEAAVKEWLYQIEMPKLSPELKASIEADMQERFNRDIRNKAYEMTQNVLAKQMKVIEEHFANSNIIEKLEATAKLLNPES